MGRRAEWHQVGACRSYTEVSSREAVFMCGDQRVSLKTVAPNVVRIWFSRTAQFSRSYPSFAVQAEELSESRWKVSESEASYGLATSELRVSVEKDPFRLVLSDSSGRILNEQFGGGFAWSDERELELRHVLPNDEAFWGLGEKSEPFNRRGQRLANWGTDLYQPDKFSPAEGEGRWYGAMPHFMSSRGYAILFDNTSRTVFDFGKGSPGVWTMGSYAPAAAGEMAYYLIYGPSPRRMIKTFTDLVGTAFFLPRHALGNGQSWWGDSWYQADMEACARSYREKRIPCDTMWACLEWYKDSFVPTHWDSSTFPHPREFIERLHEAGFRVALYDEPNLPAASREYDDARSRGFLLTDSAGNVERVNWPWGGSCGLVDFFNPEARRWWGSLHDHLLEIGVDCFWLDMNEPAVTSEHWTFHSGPGKERGLIEELHNVYALMHDRTMFEWYRATQPRKRPFFLSRSFFPGSHRYAAVWSGDVHSDFSWLEFQPRMGMSMGLSGFIYWAHDIGGYSFGNPDEELFKRWIEFAAFCPLHRFHHTSNFESPDAEPNFPWSHGAEEVSRRYITLRERLIPYFYSCIADSIIGTGLEEGYGPGGTGIPLMRTLVVDFPDDAIVYSLDDEFMSGPSFLVAPILKRGETKREVYLPSGEWYDYWNDRRYRGGRTVGYEAPVDTLPLFVRAGSIVPMMPAMQHVDEKPFDPVTLDIFPPIPEEEASFVLYEDDGETYDYEAGAWCTTKYECATAIDGGRREVEFVIRERRTGKVGFSPPERRYQLRFRGLRDEQLRIEVDEKEYSRIDQGTIEGSAEHGWYLDEPGGTCVVSLSDTGTEHRVRLLSSKSRDTTDVA